MQIGIGLGLQSVAVLGANAPGIRLSAASLPENSAEGTAVGTLSVSGGVGTYDLSLTDSAGSRFKVAGTNGVNLQAGATASNAEVAQSYNITVHADNGAGSTFDLTFAITISDVNEATPVITSNGGGSTATVSIAYNATAVTTVTATDADVSASITYSISGGADAASFTINSSTGVLALNSVQVAGDYVVIVQASDGTNTDTQTITVTVNAAPSAPVNTVAPAVTGTETEGETLTSTSGTWTGTATITYAYQWYQAVLDGSNDVVTDMDGVPLLDFPISGATSSTYVLEVGDVGEKIFCYVTATNGVGSASKASNATGLITAAASYTGIGDVVPGAAHHYGPWAYNAAYATGSNPGWDVVDEATGLITTTINITTAGVIDQAAITALGYPVRVSKEYDQIGTAHLIIRSGDTISNLPPVDAASLNGVSTLALSGSQELCRNPGFPSLPQPLSLCVLTKRGTSGGHGIVSDLSANTVLYFKTGGTNVELYCGSSLDNAGAASGSWYALQAVADNTSSDMVADGVSSTGAAGTGGLTDGSFLIGNDGFGQFLTGNIADVTVYPFALSGPQKLAIDANMRARAGL